MPLRKFLERVLDQVKLFRRLEPLISRNKIAQKRAQSVSIKLANAVLRLTLKVLFHKGVEGVHQSFLMKKLSAK